MKYHSKILLLHPSGCQCKSAGGCRQSPGGHIFCRGTYWSEDACWSSSKHSQQLGRPKSCHRVRVPCPGHLGTAWVLFELNNAVFKYVQNLWKLHWDFFYVLHEWIQMAESFTHTLHWLFSASWWDFWMKWESCKKDFENFTAVEWWMTLITYDWCKPGTAAWNRHQKLKRENHF